MKITTATLLLSAGPSLTAARWLRWSAEELHQQQHTSIPRETGALPVAGRGGADQGLLGWTPKPTPAPGARKSDQDLVVEYLRRRQYGGSSSGSGSSSSSRNTWTNEQTCGWFKGTSSSAYTCDDNFSCLTNEDHNIACGSGTYSPFFTVCLDYNAFKDGACDNANSLTGCCQASTEPACGTYIWTGSPTRSMYRCFASSTIISMLDIPQFVIDASISSASEASKSSESARLKSLTESRSGPKSSGVAASTTNDGQPGQPTSGSGEAGGINDGSDGSAGSDGSTGDGANGGGSTGGDTTNNGGGSSNNTPAIVGGVVGGLAGLLLLLLMLYFMRRNKFRCTMKRNSNKNKKEKNTTNRSSRSERKKSYKNKNNNNHTLVKESHHSDTDSWEGSHGNSRSYTPPPPVPAPSREPGAIAAPTQNTGSSGLSSLFSWLKKKEKGPNNRYDDSHSNETYHAPVGSGAPGSHGRRQSNSTHAPQQQQYPPQQFDSTRLGREQQQQQVPTTFPNSSNFNSNSFPNTQQRDEVVGNSNNARMSDQGVPTVGGIQQHQPQSHLQPQSQLFTPPANPGYTNTSVQASGPNATTSDAGFNPGLAGAAATGAAAAYQQPQSTGNSSAGATAAYQQPQFTGNSSTAPLAPTTLTQTTGTTTTTTTGTGTAPPPVQNFIFAFHNYGNPHTQSPGQNENQQQQPQQQPGVGMASYQQLPAQYTGNSSIPAGTSAMSTIDPQRTGNFAPPANSYATAGISAQTTGTSSTSTNTQREVSGMSGFQQQLQPQYTGSSSSRPLTATSTADPRRLQSQQRESLASTTTTQSSYAPRLTPQGTGTGTSTSIHDTNNDVQRGRSLSRSRRPSRVQPQLTGASSMSGFTPTSTLGPAPATTTTTTTPGVSASASAEASVNLDINQQHHHYYHHQQPENATGAVGSGDAFGYQSQSQPQQQTQRYMNSSTMTANVDKNDGVTDAAASAVRGVTGGTRDGIVTGATVTPAEYQHPHFTGASSMSGSTTRGSLGGRDADAGYPQTQQNYQQYQNRQNFQNFEITDNSSTNNITMVSAGYQGAAEKQQQQQQPQQQPQLTGTTEAATESVDGYGYVGNKGVAAGAGAGAGAGAWYQRPVGTLSDEPVELEAHPAIRKVD